MDEAIVKRIMPHSVEAEQSVIGSMLMDAEAVSVAADKLRKDDFYSASCASLFEAICQLAEEGKPADLVLVQERVKQNGAPPEVAGMDNLRAILTTVPTSANIKHYVKEVHDKSVLRKLIRVSTKIEEACYEGNEGTDSILSKAEETITELTRTGGTVELQKIDSITMDAIDQIEAASKAGGKVTGIPTGFRDLDYKLAGLHESNLVLIAARPAMGKTAFVLNIAQHVAIKHDYTTVIFSLEMSRIELVKRFLAMESKVDSNNLRTGQLTPSEWMSLAEGGSHVGESKIWIDDTPNISIDYVRERCRQLKRDEDLKLIIIDYIQLMKGRGRSESRQNEVAEISRALKGLARELDVPVIALSQLSRAVEGREDKRPMLSDLRESGAIEQDADVVMFIYRDDYYNHDTTKKGVAEIIIAKQRAGAIGTVELAWIPELTKFASMEGARNKEQKPD